MTSTSRPSRSLHRARVLGAVQALERTPARIRVQRRGGVDPRLERVDAASASVRGVGTPRAGGGIMPARSLRIIFSATSACSFAACRVEAGQRQAAGLAALAVAAGAVLPDECALIGGREGGGRSRRSVRGGGFRCGRWRGWGPPFAGGGAPARPANGGPSRADDRTETRRCLHSDDRDRHLHGRRTERTRQAVLRQLPQRSRQGRRPVAGRLRRRASGRARATSPRR